MPSENQKVMETTNRKLLSHFDPL